MSRPETEARLREALGRAPAAVVCAYVFGSVARGEARPGSDVDVALLFEKPPEARLDAGPLDSRGSSRGRWATRCSSSCSTAPRRIWSTGCFATDAWSWTGTPPHASAFEVAKRNEYFDLEPIRRRYRRTGPRHP